MKFAKYISAAILVLLMAACDSSDPGGPVTIEGASGMPDGTPLDARIKELYERYDVHIRYEFSQQTYEYNWTSSLAGMPYTPADPQYAKQVVDSLESWVFKKFPAGFIARYLPPEILLVDSVSEWHKKDYEEFLYALPGNVSLNNLVIGYAGKRFDVHSPELMAELKEAWMSLVVERMMVSKAWPSPDAFTAITGVSYGIYSGTYWNGNPENDAFWAVGSPDGSIADWWSYYILKHGRLGVKNDCFESEGWCDVWRGTIGQDFGDYVAFILCKTPAEQDAFWDEVADHPDGGDEVVAKMKQKLQLVKDYFKTNFDVTL